MVENMPLLYTEGKLDPQAETILAQIAKANAKQLTELTLQQARACFLEPSWLETVETGAEREH